MSAATPTEVLGLESSERCYGIDLRGLTEEFANRSLHRRKLQALDDANAVR